MSGRLIRFALLLVALVPKTSAAQLKPYRVLFVISDQWKDPTSFLVSGGGEFQTIVTMFKSWGVPFDILRLDQLALDPNQFIDFENRPRYGAIVWDFGADAKLSPDAELYLREAIEQLH